MTKLHDCSYAPVTSIYCTDKGCITIHISVNHFKMSACPEGGNMSYIRHIANVILSIRTCVEKTDDAETIKTHCEQRTLFGHSHSVTSSVLLLYMWKVSKTMLMNTRRKYGLKCFTCVWRCACVSQSVTESDIHAQSV